MNGRSDADGQATDVLRRRILEHALHAFGHRGVRATSLSYVAKAAGVSRPTLYARFENKDVLFDSVVRMVTDDAVRAAEAALSGDGALGDVVGEGLAAFYGTLHERTAAMPFVDELLEHHGRTTAALTTAAVEKVRGIVQARLEAALNGAPVCSPYSLDDVVTVLMTGATSLKRDAASTAAFMDRIRCLAHLVVRGLQA